MFNTNSTTKRVVALLLAATVLLSTAGGVATAAKPSIDTETTDTPSESDLTAGDTITYNESANNAHLQFIADSSNAAVSIEGPDGNEVYYNDSAETVDSASDTYRVAIDPVGDFEDLEVGGGENVTLTATITNNTEADSPDELTETLNYQNTEESATIVIDDVDADGDIVSFGTLGVSQYVPFMGSDVKSASIEETVNISGENTTTATFDVANGSVEDSISESVGDDDSGEWVPAAYGKANGHFVPVFAAENPDVPWLDTDEDAFAVADSDGDTVTVHNLNAVTSSDDEDVEFSMHTNENMGFWNAQSMFRDLGASSLSWPVNALQAIQIPLL